MLFWGLQYTTASRGAVFLNLAPFVVAVAGHFLLGERLGRASSPACLRLPGRGAGLFRPLSLPSRDALFGDTLCVGAAILWGMTTVTVKATVLSRVAPEKTLLYQLGVSAVLGFALSAARRGVEPGMAVAVMPAFLYQAIWVAAITYLAWFALIRSYPVSLLASFTFLTPLFGVAFGAALLNDPLSPHLFAALLLVAVGIYLVNRAPTPARQQGSP